MVAANLEKETAMKLIDSKTGLPIQQGDTVELRGDSFIVSHIDYGARRVFLIDLEADKSPFAIPAVSIGAEFRRSAA